MSTPRREEVEQKATSGAALIRIAVAADAFREEVSAAYPDLEGWEQGYACAFEETSQALAVRFRATGELQVRVAEDMRSERAADAHLRALDYADELNGEIRRKSLEVGVSPEEVGSAYQYVSEVARRSDLPTARPDTERAGYEVASGGDTLNRRVYAVVGEEPVCVAVEEDGEWSFVKEVP